MAQAADTLRTSLRLGFGCSGAWAQRWYSARDAERLVLTALEGGVRHFDTAGFYAGGEAERRLAAALRQWPEPVFISSKTGTHYRPGGARKDFSPNAIRADVEASLRRLGRERLDLLYLHGPSADQQAQGLETLARLKEEGKIGRAGVCGEGEGLRRAVAAEGVDVIMGVYNAFRREHGECFAAARRAGIAVVAIAPLAQGLYRNDFFAVASPADAWRVARALVRNRRELAAARAARAALESIPGWRPAQLLLAFALSNPAIDVAVTTSTDAARLGESIAAAGRSLSPAIIEVLNSLST